MKCSVLNDGMLHARRALSIDRFHGAAHV